MARGSCLPRAYMSAVGFVAPSANGLPQTTLGTRHPFLTTQPSPLQELLPFSPSSTSIMTANTHQPASANEADNHGDEVPNPTPPDIQPAPPALLNITFSNSGGEEVHFKMKPTTRLAKAKVRMHSRWHTEEAHTCRRCITVSALVALLTACAFFSRENACSTTAPQRSSS